eukprot:COSAG02_NODE_2765_length_8068_cov_6.824319_8_plen_113_part_00
MDCIPLNRPFPGAKLDVPRLAAPRGPARGRARANRPSLSVCYLFESHSGGSARARRAWSNQSRLLRAVASWPVLASQRWEGVGGGGQMGSQRVEEVGEALRRCSFGRALLRW